ncbi:MULTISPECIES: CBS domain-containing protein [Streptomyces]|uniref:CBS domain-containing protein n=1 Tax=Streptomyces TaxID=1883 RepID=UPI0019C0187B|nr:MULTISPECIES: CBS domain-containing protein [Streptomyces]GGT02735.1 hypothetical protein GCM10010286_29940 [Streptomyces toxytricini]
MKHTKAADLMTGEVVSVTPDTSFKDIVKLLAQHDVSGVPVLDAEDRVVGVVSQTDLLAGAPALLPGPQDAPDGRSAEPPGGGRPHVRAGGHRARR